MCRCVRADLEADATKVFNPLGAGGNPPSGARMFDERRGVVYETVAAGYGEATGTSCQAPDDRAPAVGLSRVWLAVRCEVDICGDACRFNLSATRLPYSIDENTVLKAPLAGGDAHFYTVKVGDYDVVEVVVDRLSEYGVTPDYQLAPPSSPPPPPSLPPPSAPNITVVGPPEGVNATDPCASVCPVGVCDSFDDAGKPECAECASCQLAAEADARARRRLVPTWPPPLMAHGLVGTAYLLSRACPSPDTWSARIDVGNDKESGGHELFCTDSGDGGLDAPIPRPLSRQGDLYVAVHATTLIANITMPPRHWYRIRVNHERFDASNLASATPRDGCLAFGQWRRYEIQTTGLKDATLELVVSVPVTALYAKRGSPPTASDNDAVARWPLQTLSLSSCDVREPIVWHVAVALAEDAPPPQLEQRFTLTSTLLSANASLVHLDPGTQIQLPPAYLCCGAYRDYVVPAVTRALALRVEVTVHAGSLQAIYLKHDACARFDTDVTEAEECAGQCSMRWLTTFNPITLEPSYKRSDVVSVPMGIVRADRRAAGDWYISVAAPMEGTANFSLRAELVESVLMDEYLPLDEEAAAAERCGRFCVILPEDEGDEGDEDDDDDLESGVGGKGGGGVVVAVAAILVSTVLARRRVW